MVEVDIDIESEIESAVEEAMANYEPDYDEIRYQIENDILNQVDENIDWSNAEYNLDIGSLIDEHLDYKELIDDDNLGDKIVDIVNNGCHITDKIAVNLMTRAFDSQVQKMAPFHLPSLEDWNELQAQVQALSQIIDTSSVRTSLQDGIVNSYIAKEINTETLMNTIADLRNERYQAIRYLSKPELIAWAAENGFGDLSDMKVADMHKVIL